MAEPQPPNVSEGADQPDVLPATAEDAKAAKAMSSLDVKGDDESSAPKKEVDMKALNDAMAQLGGGEQKSKQPATGAAAKKEEKKLVKVDQADVGLLAEQLDMSKAQATDLLRAHDADAVKTMTSWVKSEP